MTARIELDNSPVDRRENALFAGSDGRALRRHRFADRNLQAERRRSARLSCYVDGHDVELWEGTRQVALLTRSNLPFDCGGLLQLRARRRQAVCLGTINGRGGYLYVSGFPGTSVCSWTGASAPGGFPCCVREGSMSVVERTTYRRSLGSNALAFDEPRRDPQQAPHTSGPSTDCSVDDSISLSDLQDQPDPREFAPLAASQRTSILARVVAGGLVVSAFAILVAVGVFNSDVTRVLIDKARAPMGGATQSAMQAVSTQPAVRQIPLEDPAPVSDPVTPASVNASSARLETPSAEAAPQSQAPAARTGNEAPAPSKTLDAETLAALMIRAKSLLALGDIAAARLLLERAANAQNAAAAFLLARTYDPAVLGVRDARSITADPVMARDWYRRAASFGSADAQQRLTQLQN
jgi:hypothetical protein